jgi:creatinine amidohydrolase/Fe(II)-dependent formamide hydrolase-like protein
MARARDYRPPGYLNDRTQRLKLVPADSPGSIGEPTLATAEKGGLIFERILQRVRAKVFLAAEEAELR